MKKLATLLLLSTVALAGCSSVQRSLRGDDYVDSSLAAEESSKVAAQSAKELNDALTNENANFPQLSKEVAEDEAEVILHTSQGDIRIKLFPKLAPLAVENFLTHAKEGYYNGITFHRVIDGFMVQTGVPKGDGTGGQSIWHDKDKTKDKGTGFKNEITPYLYNIRGALAMANTGQPNTNGSQFFINQSSTDTSSKLPTSKYPQKIIEAYKEGGNPSLDGKHPVFGQVIDGMDVVDKIAKAEKDEKDKPTTAITIDSIEVVKDYDFKS
ncbi:peptidyl-prolyl cis-trans isomerase [Streptococcus pneumoniae]|uniref:peptidylprolyl isomerase n=1 Tax=Streptococcus pneumoniae TaxID=1313 RepID=UPI0005E46ED5|nr:peptidylprolyl isomerase [Streptococcus pneumoniae]CKC15412.1 peptidyl-prolyl cis-trans isomerase [Streptococcus pneumoniae]